MLTESDEDIPPPKMLRGRGGQAGGRVRGQRIRGRGRPGRGCGRTACETRQAGTSASAQAAGDVTDETWTEVDAAPQQFSFIGDPGVKISLSDWTSPYAIFRLFFTASLIDMIVLETNRYAAEMLPKTKTAWFDVTADDIMCFLALFILMGNIRKPKMQSYWSTDAMIAIPFFGTVMARNRFFAILKFLHFVDNSAAGNAANDDRLRKIRPVVEHLRGMFQSVFMPYQYVSVDESLLLWKGRLGWKQYIPKKRSRFGIKTYELCDSITGYLWNFSVYTGKAMASAASDLSSSSQIVIDLMAGLLNKGHCVITDNFYTCPALFQSLITHKTDAFGTVRLHRKGMPSALKKAKLKKGETKFRRSGKLLAISWHDKRQVSMLSTLHDGSIVQTLKTDRDGNAIWKPNVVLEYNKYMGGVDKLDQMIEPYISTRKTLKWYKKFFSHLLDISIYNAFVLFKITNPDSKSTLLSFRSELVEGIITAHHNGRRQYGGRPSGSGDMPARLTDRHFPSYIPPTASRQDPKRECRVCGASKRDGHRLRKQTRFMCAPCGSVALCVVPCFRQYHTLVNYEHENSSSDDD